MSIKRVLFVVAMEAEASPFVSALSLAPCKSVFPASLPFRSFSGSHNGLDVTVVTSGKDATYSTGVDNVGTLPAGVMTTLALQSSSFDLCINAGTCGGFSRKGAEIGSVFLTKGAAFHDRRIDIPGTPFKDYGTGKMESLSTTNLQAAIGAHEGICSTSDSLDHDERDDERMEFNDTSVKDMESAAIHWACNICNVPHFGVKVVTDIVDCERPSAEQFMENLGSAAKKLQETLPKVLNFVAGKEIKDL